MINLIYHFVYEFLDIFKMKRSNATVSKEQASALREIHFPDLSTVDDSVRCAAIKNTHVSLSNVNGRMIIEKRIGSKKNVTCKEGKG